MLIGNVSSLERTTTMQEFVIWRMIAHEFKGQRSAFLTNFKLQAFAGLDKSREEGFERVFLKHFIEAFALKGATRFQSV